jgi:hypothetical protein
MARAAFKVAIAEKPAARFMIRNRIRVVKRHPEGDWYSGPHDRHPKGLRKTLAAEARESKAI